MGTVRALVVVAALACSAAIVFIGAVESSQEQVRLCDLRILL